MAEVSDISVYYLPYNSKVAVNCVLEPAAPSEPATPAPHVVGWLRNCAPMEISIVASAEGWRLASPDGTEQTDAFDPAETPYLLLHGTKTDTIDATAHPTTRDLYATMNVIRQAAVQAERPVVQLGDGPFARLTLGLGALLGRQTQYATGTMQELGLQLTLPRSGGLFWLAPITSGLRATTFQGTRAAAAYEAPTLPFSGYSTDMPIGLHLDLDWMIRACSDQWREPLAPPRVNVVAGYDTPLIGSRHHDAGDMRGTHTALLYPGQDHRFSLGAELSVTEYLLVGVTAFHNVHGGPLPLHEDGVRITVSMGHYVGQGRPPAPAAKPVIVISPRTGESRGGDITETAATPLR